LEIALANDPMRDDSKALLVLDVVKVTDLLTTPLRHEAGQS
jgi:hypothetical protein